MANWTAYKSRPKLLDVTISGIAAGTTDVAIPVDGNLNSGGNVSVGTNPNITSIVRQGQVADAFLVTVTPVIQSATSFPDCEIWFDNGTSSQRGYQVFDVGYPVDMLPDLDVLEPNPELVQLILLIGRPTRDVLREHAASLAAGRGGVPNLPTAITGWKVTDRLVLHVASSAGWSNPIVPMRVEVYADIYTQQDLAEFAGIPYDGAISWEIPPTAPFGPVVHVWPGYGTIDGWAAGPGGPGQSGSVKVNRRIAYAYNAQSASGLYVLSQQNGVNGKTGNVSSADTTRGQNQYHDLGEVLTNSKNAVFIDRVGFNLYNPGDQAYVSWQVDGQTVPQETQNGIFVSSQRNRLAYGHDSTCGSSGSRYQTLGPADRLARVLMYRNAVAPAFQPVSGTIAAGNASFAYAGVKVEVA